MMFIEIQKLNQRGAYSGELEFEYEPSNSLIAIPFVSFKQKALVKVHYEILQDDSVEIAGKVEYVLQGACSRCLTETQKPMEGIIDAYFLHNEQDEENYSYVGSKLDLTTCVNDAILSSMPSKLLCREDCEGIQYSK